jgi:H+/gluconate symporter-like permease
MLNKKNILLTLIRTFALSIIAFLWFAFRQNKFYWDVINFFLKILGKENSEAEDWGDAIRLILFEIIFPIILIFSFLIISFLLPVFLKFFKKNNPKNS